MKVSSDVRFAVIPEWLLDTDVSHAAIRLYGILDRHAGSETGVAERSRRQLAERLRCSRDTVDRALKELEKVGAVRVERDRESGSGDFDPNRYILQPAGPVLRQGGRTDAARGGGRTDAAHKERKPLKTSRREASLVGAANNGKKDSFVKRLAAELSSSHGVSFEPSETRHEATRKLLAAALEHLPKERQRPSTIGVIADYVEAVQGEPIGKQARSHLARLVNMRPPLVVLDAFGEALSWGAGIPPEYADDPLSLTKYVTSVLSKNGKR